MPLPPVSRTSGGWICRRTCSSPEQFEHQNCRPFRFAVELGEPVVGDCFVRFELLIRSEQTMRCACIGYATRQQRDFILGYADRLVEELALRT